MSVKNIALKKRLSLYKELLKVVCKDPDTHIGYCWYISNRLEKWRKLNNYPFINAYNEEKFKKHLPELYAHKPETMINGYWFSCTRAGWQKRINILVEIINDLEKKLKHEKS